MMAAAELLGGMMLILGICVRAVAVTLLPVAIGAAAVHLGMGFEVTPAYGAYLAGCLAGQALLASGAFTRFDPPIMVGSTLRA